MKLLATAIKHVEILLYQKTLTHYPSKPRNSHQTPIRCVNYVQQSWNTLLLDVQIRIDSSDHSLDAIIESVSLFLRRLDRIRKVRGGQPLQLPPRDTKVRQYTCGSFAVTPFTRLKIKFLILRLIVSEPSRQCTPSTGMTRTVCPSIELESEWNGKTWGGNVGP